MKAKVVTLDNKAAGEVTLNKAIFGLPERGDVLQRVVTWQLAKRQAGTHKTKLVSDISGTTAKPFRQKGTGNARQGTRRAAQMRGGGTAFGPVVRSHAHSLPKKIRSLGLKTALSSKLASGNLVVLKDAKLKDVKTKQVAQQLKGLGFESALIIDSNEGDASFSKAIANLPAVDVIPSKGANVYDILKKENLVITESAIKELEERLA
jgi:large subunit ribosomal protein L4